MHYFGEYHQHLVTAGYYLFNVFVSVTINYLTYSFLLSYTSNQAKVSGKRKCHIWSSGDLDQTLTDTEHGDLRLNGVAQHYGIPKATLSHHKKQY